MNNLTTREVVKLYGASLINNTLTDEQLTSLLNDLNIKHSQSHHSPQSAFISKQIRRINTWHARHFTEEPPKTQREAIEAFVERMKNQLSDQQLYDLIRRLVPMEGHKMRSEPTLLKCILMTFANRLYVVKDLSRDLQTLIDTAFPNNKQYANDTDLAKKSIRFTEGMKALSSKLPAGWEATFCKKIVIPDAIKSLYRDAFHDLAKQLVSNPDLVPETLGDNLFFYVITPLLIQHFDEQNQDLALGILGEIKKNKAEMRTLAQMALNFRGTELQLGTTSLAKINADFYAALTKIVGEISKIITELPDKPETDQTLFKIKHDSLDSRASLLLALLGNIESLTERKTMLQTDQLTVHLTDIEHAFKKIHPKGKLAIAEKMLADFKSTFLITKKAATTPLIQPQEQKAGEMTRPMMA